MVPLDSDLSRSSVLGNFSFFVWTENFHFKEIRRSRTLKKSFRASLVVQWIGFCLPIQGTSVRSVVQEDSTCLGATKPVSSNYCTEARAHKSRVTQQEKPPQRDGERAGLVVLICLFRPIEKFSKRFVHFFLKTRALSFPAPVPTQAEETWSSRSHLTVWGLEPSPSVSLSCLGSLVSCPSVV